MPAKFNACVKQGGKVRTIKVSGTKFQHICFLGNKSFAGEIKTRKKKR